MIIRPETPDDFQAIRDVTEQAFGRPEEARLIDALRSNGNVILSLVALHDDRVTGHILFFPLHVENASQKYDAVGLGPMAVSPQFQKQGIGSALVRTGLDELRKGAHPGVIVLGHPEFYPRFAFVPASTFGIGTHYEVPDEAFMAIELTSGGLSGKGGTVVYSQEFDEV